MLRTIAAFSLLALTASTGLAQSQDLPPVVPVAPAIAEAEVPPGQLLGQRAASLQARRPTLRTLSDGPDESSALDAISLWTINAYWPVLIDDGSTEAALDIARFVRAFEPTEIRVVPPTNEANEHPPIPRVRID